MCCWQSGSNDDEGVFILLVFGLGSAVAVNHMDTFAYSLGAVGSES